MAKLVGKLIFFLMTLIEDFFDNVRDEIEQCASRRWEKKNGINEAAKSNG